MDIKLALADNQTVFRTGFARFLAVEDGYRIVGQCDDPERLYKLAESSRDSVIAFASSLDPDMPKLTALAAAGRNRLLAILERGESPQAMLEHKISGIIYRDVSREDLIEAVRTVGRGSSFVQNLPTKSAAQFETDMVGDRVRSRLSKKELQIISLLIRGYKNKDIARALNNTEQVIKNYLRSIFDKTGVSDRLELVLFTMHHKLLFDAVETAAPKQKNDDLPDGPAPAAMLANLNGWTGNIFSGSKPN
jgi:DNA-binding NarL/FixJ family response regulator